MSATADAYLAQLQALLPPGADWWFWWQVNGPETTVLEFRIEEGVLFAVPGRLRPGRGSGPVRFRVSESRFSSAARPGE